MGAKMDGTKRIYGGGDPALYSMQKDEKRTGQSAAPRSSAIGPLALRELRQKPYPSAAQVQQARAQGGPSSNAGSSRFPGHDATAFQPSPLRNLALSGDCLVPSEVNQTLMFRHGSLFDKQGEVLPAVKRDIVFLAGMGTTPVGVAETLGFEIASRGHPPNAVLDVLRERISVIDPKMEKIATVTAMTDPQRVAEILADDLHPDIKSKIWIKAKSGLSNEAIVKDIPGLDSADVTRVLRESLLTNDGIDLRKEVKQNIEARYDADQSDDEILSAIRGLETSDIENALRDRLFAENSGDLLPSVKNGVRRLLAIGSSGADIVKIIRGIREADVERIRLSGDDE